MISTIKKINALLAYRLNFYYNTMWERILKFKLLLLVIMGLLMPSASMLLHIAEAPYQFILSSKTHSLQNIIFMLVFILLLHSLWILVQRTPVVGGILRHYFITYPFNPKIWLISDISLIIISNGLLWIPILATAIYPSKPFMTFYIKLTLLITTIIFLQYVVLKMPGIKITKTLDLRTAFLWRTAKISLALKSLFILSIILAAYIIATRSQLGPLPTLCLTIGIIHYTSSGWFKLFHDEHAKYAPYFKQFSYYAKIFHASDIRFIFVYNLAFQIPLFIAFMIHSLLDPKKLGIILLLQLPLSLLLSVLEPRYKNKVHIFAILATFGWIYLSTRILALC